MIYITIFINKFLVTDKAKDMVVEVYKKMLPNLNKHQNCFMFLATLNFMKNNLFF